MLLRRRKRLQVVVDDLDSGERELLSGFLRSLGVDVVLSGSKMSVDSGQLSLDELKTSVNKFFYHKNLNRKYWVAVDGDGVRVSRFEKARKPEKRRKEGTRPQTITHGW